MLNSKVINKGTKMKNLPENEILNNRKKIYEIFYKKRGMNGRKYTRDYKLCQPTLTSILLGKTLLSSESFNHASPAFKVVKQLDKDGMWIGPIPYGMIKNPLIDFHKGANLGAFSEDGSLVVSNGLINHLKIGSIHDYEEVFLLAAIDAFSSRSGTCTKSDEELSRVTGMNISSIEEEINSLWRSAWLSIKSHNGVRHIKVIEANPAIKAK
ncbi:MAG: Unknown protein [uncultured Sulfurovum sp.]|uniref:Uncharacterized protein n=1 Tax=uncultured Sulfurovum sp. TaxID=269237 RepID=A0A6S6SGL5_9BACT|nr:MAG: Unknown protein [uncultured Sulfurovum sp.]